MGQRVTPVGVDLGRRQKVYVLLVDRIGEATVERVGWNEDVELWSASGARGRLERVGTQ